MAIAKCDAETKTRMSDTDHYIKIMTSQSRKCIIVGGRVLTNESALHASMTRTPAVTTRGESTLM